MMDIRTSVEIKEEIKAAEEKIRSYRSTDSWVCGKNLDDTIYNIQCTIDDNIKTLKTRFGIDYN